MSLLFSSSYFSKGKPFSIACMLRNLIFPSSRWVFKSSLKLGVLRGFFCLLFLSRSWGWTSPVSTAGTSLTDYEKKNRQNWVCLPGDSGWVLRGRKDAEEFTGFLEGLPGEESSGMSLWIPLIHVSHTSCGTPSMARSTCPFLNSPEFWGQFLHPPPSSQMWLMVRV